MPPHFLTAMPLLLSLLLYPLLGSPSAGSLLPAIVRHLTAEASSFSSDRRLDQAAVVVSAALDAEAARGAGIPENTFWGYQEVENSGRGTEGGEGIPGLSGNLVKLGSFCQSCRHITRSIYKHSAKKSTW